MPCFGLNFRDGSQSRDPLVSVFDPACHLKRVFGTEVYVDTNTLTGKLLVVPLSKRAQQDLAE